MKEFELVFYTKPNGECPVSEFFVDLVAQNRRTMITKILHAMDQLELFGNIPRGDYSKALKDGNGIFELRAQTKTDISRIFYFFDKGGKIVLLHGIIKKQQRLSFPKDIELAQRERADYLSRCQEQNKKQGKAVASAPFTVGTKFRPQLDQIVAEASAKRDKTSISKTEKDRGR